MTYNVFGGTLNLALSSVYPHVIGIGLQWATTNVRRKATVVSEVRRSCSNERLMYEPCDLEHGGSMGIRNER